jgi:hypothetical protein
MPPTERPSRTFSLARLMAVVTMVCVVCGMAVSLPGLAQIYLVVLVVALPMTLVHLMLARMVTDRNQLAVIVILGFVVGMFLEEPFVVRMVPFGFDRKGLAQILTYYALATIPPAIMAILFAASFVLVTRLFRWWSARK